MASVNPRSDRWEQNLRQFALIDELTGLNSCGQFYRSLESEVERARRFGDALGLMLIDVDDLREINSRGGTELGDRVLTRLGRHLRRALRKIDSAFRYGGEEFAVIVPRAGRADLHAAAERIRRGFAAAAAPAEERATLSIGATCYRRGSPLESFIRGAEEALYRAKHAGKNQVVLDERAC